MDLIKDLQNLGLTAQQAKVYLSCLQLGRDTVLNIAKHADLKRPTVYLMLDDLAKKGLVTLTKKTNTTLYKAEEPSRLLSQVKMQEEIAKSIIPSLKAIYNIDPSKPNIKIAEGSQSVRNVYNGIFSYLSEHPQEELMIFGSLKDASKNFQSEVIDYFTMCMAKSKNAIREIGNDDQETRKYYRASKKLNPNHEIRLIRTEGQFTKIDDMLYGNTLIIFSVTDQIFATIIESPFIAETYKTLFNMAWKSGKKYVYPAPAGARIY